MFAILKMFALAVGFTKGLLDSLSWGTFVLSDLRFEQGKDAQGNSLEIRNAQRVRVERSMFIGTGIVIEDHDLRTAALGEGGRDA